MSRALETTTGQAGVLDEFEHPADAAERLRLHHEDVGGARLGDRQRVIRSPDALVGGDRDAHVLDADADLEEVGDAHAGLLDVLEIERRERVDGVLGLVDVPATVGVDADAALGAECLAHGSHAGDVLRERLVGCRDLHFRRTASGESGEHRRHAVGIDGGDRRVHGDAVAQDRRRRVPAEVDRRGEPGGCLVVGVLRERRELRPSLGTLEHHRLAHLDAAEPGDERQRHDPGGAEQLVEGRQGSGGAGVGHAPIVAPRTPERPSSVATQENCRDGRCGAVSAQFS